MGKKSDLAAAPVQPDVYADPPPSYEVSQQAAYGSASRGGPDVGRARPKVRMSHSSSSSMSSSSSSSSLSSFSGSSDEGFDHGQPLPRRSSLPPTRSPSGTRLLKPIAIPATSPKLGSPFMRAYPPSLNMGANSVPPEIFLQFLDDLNRVAVASPPLQVLGLAGVVVSFVPNEIAMIVGNSVQAAVKAGTVAVSKGRTEMFMRKANKEIFGPRGLKAEIAKIDALAKIAGMPILNAEGKIDKHTPILDPIEDLVVSRRMSGQQRRLKALERWIASLEVSEMPEVQGHSNPLSKMSQNASEKQRRKEERRMMKGRKRAYKHMNKSPEAEQEELEARMARFDLRAEKVRERGEERGKSDYKIQRRLEKVERKREKAQRKHEKKMGRSDEDKLKKRTKKDKEEKKMRKILWLVVRNADADSGEGIDPYLDEPPEERAELEGQC